METSVNRDSPFAMEVSTISTWLARSFDSRYRSSWPPHDKWQQWKVEMNLEAGLNTY
jgi:hypothetical protein